MSFRGEGMGGSGDEASGQDETVGQGVGSHEWVGIRRGGRGEGVWCGSDWVAGWGGHGGTLRHLVPLSSASSTTLCLCL